MLVPSSSETGSCAHRRACEECRSPGPLGTPKWTQHLSRPLGDIKEALV